MNKNTHESSWTCYTVQADGWRWSEPIRTCMYVCVWLVTFNKSDSRCFVSYCLTCRQKSFRSDDYVSRVLFSLPIPHSRTICEPSTLYCRNKGRLINFINTSYTYIYTIEHLFIPVVYMYTYTRGDNPHSIVSPGYVIWREGKCSLSIIWWCNCYFIFFRKIQRTRFCHSQYISCPLNSPKNLSLYRLFGNGRAQMLFANSLCGYLHVGVAREG